MFKNKLAAVIMAVFTAITFSVAAQTAEAKPVRPAPGQVLVPPRYVKDVYKRQVSERADIFCSNFSLFLAAAFSERAGCAAAFFIRSNGAVLVFGSNGI